AIRPPGSDPGRRGITGCLVAAEACLAKSFAVRLRKNAKIELLRKVPLFEKASQRELARVESIALEVEYAQGVTLIHEGSSDDGFFILLQGARSAGQSSADNLPRRLSSATGPELRFPEHERHCPGGAAVGPGDS